jgi:hypothetical protein
MIANQWHMTFMSDGRSAQVFQSREKIALQEAPIRRFQLREEPPNGTDKTLMSQLPVASASSVKFRNIGGELVPVSEIYLQFDEMWK